MADVGINDVLRDYYGSVETAKCKLYGLSSCNRLLVGLNCCINDH